MKKLISVIIPTYKRSYQVLEKAILSVIKQAGVKIEIIVVIDGVSSLDIAEVLKLSKDIKVISNEDQKGPAEARNRGIENANGEYIAFLDDDDEWVDAEKLLKQKLLLDADKKIGIVTTYRKFTDSDGKDLKIKKDANNDEDFRKKILKGCCLGLSTAIIRKEVFEKVGGFNKKWTDVEDYELFLRIGAKYKVGVVTEECVRKNQHLNSNIHRKMIKAFFLSNILVWLYRKKYGGSVFIYISRIKKMCHTLVTLVKITPKGKRKK